MTTEEWVNRIFDAWNANHIPFVVMRGHEGLPCHIGNDLDILFDPQQCEEAEQVCIRTIEQHGGRVHNRVAFGAACLYFHDPKTLEQYHFDFYERPEWRGFDFLSSDAVLQQAQPVRNYTIPSELHEVVLCLLTRLLYGGYVNRKYTSHVFAFTKKEPQSMGDVLAVCFGRKLGRMLLDDILNERWSHIDAIANWLRLSLMLKETLRHPFRSLRSVASDLFRLINRWMRLPGLVVAVHGGGDSAQTIPFALDVCDALKKSFYPQIGMIVVDRGRTSLPKAADQLPRCTEVPSLPIKSALFWWRVRRRLFQNAMILDFRDSRSSIPGPMERLVLGNPYRMVVEFGANQRPDELVKTILINQSQRIAGTVE